MKSKKAYLSIVLTLCMVFSAVLSPVWAAPDTSASLTADAKGSWDNDALFSKYAERAFYGELLGGQETLSASDPAGGRLTGADRALYDFLKEKIEGVAQNGGSTVFVLPTAELFPDLPTEWTSADLGVDIVRNNTVTREAVLALFGKYTERFDFQRVFDALLADCPYELYWFKKNSSDGNNGGAKITCVSANNEFRYDNITGTLSLSQFYATFYVADAYRAGDSDTVVTDAVSKVQTAVNKANELAAKTYASDYARLRGFVTDILNLSGYNHDVVGNPNTPYGDPWQLIDVFDGDPATKVVCEGFSKAFQYLCDLAQSKGYLKGVNCYIVTGFLSASGGGATGAGPHMWNVVTLEGKNYLVDVTNCTVDNLSLALAGSAGPQSSSVTSGNEDYPGAPDYSFPMNGSTYAHYWYAAEEKALWGEDVLKLDSTGYEAPPAELTGQVRITGKAKYGEQLTASVSNLPTSPAPDLTYQWYRGETAIPDAVNRTYTLVSDDVGQTVKVAVSANNYTGSLISSDTGPVAGPDPDHIHAMTVDCESTGDTLSFKTLDSSYSGGTLASGSYWLTEDLRLWQTIEISGTVNLCLNGHVIRTESGDDPVFEVKGTLNLCDCNNENLSHKFSPSSPNWVLDETRGTETVEGGVITGGHGSTTDSSSYGKNIGGGITVNGGTVNMYGGNICGNYSGGKMWNDERTGSYGGGVGVKDGTFNLFGGSIRGNCSEYGGGVGLENGCFNLYGGSVSNNMALYCGGGVCYTTSRATAGSGINIHGGRISQNTVEEEPYENYYVRGGIGVFSYSPVTMTGGEISDNSGNCNGGGIYCSGSNGNLTISGSSIVGNAALGCDGGGIYFNGSDFNMSGSTIAGNSAGNSQRSVGLGGGVYVGNSSTVKTVNIMDSTIGGDTDQEGNSAGHGGGIYVCGQGIVIRNSVISQNKTSYINSYSNPDGRGGGVYFESDSSDSKVNVLENCTITNNTAIQGSGAIYTDDPVTLAGHSLISGNTGGVLISNSILQISGNVEMRDNEGPQGDHVDVKFWNYPVDTERPPVQLTGALTVSNPVLLTCSYITPVLTKNWETYMSGKDPADYFTTQSNRVIKQNGDELGMGGRITVAPAVNGTVEVRDESGREISEFYTWPTKIHVTAVPAEGFIVDTVKYDSSDMTAEADGTYSTKLYDGTTIIATFKSPSAVDITITGTDETTAYTGSSIDVSRLFAIPDGAGTATYSLLSSGTTGQGTLSGSQLTVTRVGDFTVKVDTEESRAYNAGTASATLTVTRGTQEAPAAPTKRIATDTVITLNTIAANANGAAAVYSMDDGVTWQESPEFSGLTKETEYAFVARYEETELYEASPISAAANISTTEEPTYTLTLTAPDFPAVTEGYAQPDARGLTIRSIGNSDAVITGAAISGDNAASFVLNKTDGAVIAQGTTDDTTYTVRPVAGLSAGTYTATVTVTYNGGAVVTGELTFTVEEEEPEVYSVTQNLTDLTSSFTDMAITQGRPLTAALTAADGYELPETVTVTMGGSELTAGTDYTYTDGIVTIPVVNGDVVITAAGVKKSSGGSGHHSSAKHPAAPEITVTQPEEDGKLSEDKWDNPFVDVHEDDWFYPAVEMICGGGLMSGTSSTNFAPNSVTTRGMLVTVLYHMANEPETTADVRFADVAEGRYYTAGVAWAAEKGIVSGYKNGSFGPADLITREQLAVMLWRYAGSPAGQKSGNGDTSVEQWASLTGFTDHAKVSSWAKDAVNWAVENKIISGKGGGLLDPNGKATRAEVVAMLMNYLKTEKE